MVCPYCGTRNSSNSAICAECGAILRESQTVKTGPIWRISFRVFKPRIGLGSLAVILTAPVIAFLVGYFLGGVAFEHSKRNQALFGVAAAVLSVITVLIVSFGRVTLLRIVYGSRRKKLSKKIADLISTTENETQKILDEQNSSENRYRLASVYLLANELDKSVHQFEQAQALSAPIKSQDLNNLAVALSLRGQVSASYERLERAVSVNASSIEAKFNLARLLNQTGRDVDARAAELKLMESAKLLKSDEGLLSQLGFTFLNRRRFDDAIRCFEQASKLSANSKDKVRMTDSRNNIAVANALADRRSQSQSEFAGILRTEPENARAIANLGVLLISNGRLQDAIERLLKALQYDPALPLAYCNLGYAYATSGSVNEGIRSFRTANLLDANIFEAQYNLGKAYLDEGILDIAEKNLIRAVQMRRTAWQVHHAMGVLFYKRGLHEKAIASFNDSLKLSPLETITLTAIGITQAIQGNKDAAYDQLRLALEHDDQNPEVLTNLSWIEINRKELHSASDFANKALAADKTIAPAYNNLGLCQLELGAADVALDMFKKAFALDASLVKLHNHLASAHAKLEQIENAIREWQIAKKAEPGNADIYSNLGVALYKTGRVEDAIAEFKRVTSIRLDRKEDYINLGLALATGGHHKEAIAQFDKALALDPRNAAVHSNRGLACYYANRVEEAMREWSLVTLLDPAYAKRRGKKQETEYDDEIIEYIPLRARNRALLIEPHTAGYIYRYLPGYFTDKWQIVAPIPELETVPSLQAQVARIERRLRALDIT